MKRMLIVLCLALLLLPSAYSLIATIGNAKAVLSVDASPQQPAILERTMEVINRNDIAVLITIEPNDILSHFIEIHDNNFVLEPGEQKSARYTLVIDRGGKFDGRLNVGFIPADPDIGEHGSGLSSQLLIISRGPEIPLPESPPKPEEPEHLVPVVTPNIEDLLGREQQNVTVATENFPVREGPTTNPAVDEARRRAGPSPLAGAIIILAVIAIGLGGYFIIRKK